MKTIRWVKRAFEAGDSIPGSLMKTNELYIKSWAQ